MLPKTVLLALLAALAVAAPVEDVSTADEDSSDAAAKGKGNCGGTHIIAARGSHPYGEACTGNVGNMNLITEPVHKRVKSVTYSYVNYPAALPGQCGIDYGTSLNDGITNMKAQIHNHVQKCGNKAKISLVGYSQGAQVITELLSQGLSKNEHQALQSVVLIADPEHQAKTKYNVGTNGSGVAGIPKPGAVASLGKKVVSYCQKGDQYCDPAHYQDGNMIHENEVGHWAGHAISFISSRAHK